MIFTARGTCYTVDDLLVEIFNGAAARKLLEDLKEAVEEHEQRTAELERVSTVI